LAAVPTIVAPQLGKLIALLSSNRDGEVLAAVNAIGRLLQSNGCDFHDLSAAICAPHEDVDWRRQARFCNRHRAHLTARELDFIATLARWHGEPTDKQRQWLGSIVERVQRNISEPGDARF
jgi:hypothetical protein